MNMPQFASEAVYACNHVAINYHAAAYTGSQSHCYYI